MRNVFLLILFVLPVFLFAEEKFETTPGDPFGFHTFKLENGLTVILAKNTDQPKIQSYIMVRAGSLDDPERSTGLAHYFEHMMFKGTSKIAALNWEKEKPLLDKIEELFEQYRQEKDPAKRKEIYAEIDKISSEAAQYSNDEYWDILRTMDCDEINAFTTYDITAYETLLPSDMLEPFLTLEAERFSNIAMRRFHTELETVYEEFNRTQDNDRRQALNALLKLIAGEKHPLARPIIGKPEHLKSPSIRDVKDFFKRYYVPENMVLILVGDLDYENAAALVRKTFGKLPAGKVAAKNPVPAIKPLSKPLTTEITGPESEFLYMAIPLQMDWKENGYLRDLLFSVLYNGKNGLFDANLFDSQKVQNISCWLFSIANENLLIIFAKPLAGQSLEQLRTLIEAELDNLKKGNFDPAILTAAVNNDRYQLMTTAEKRSTTAEVALKLEWYHIRMQDMLDDLKKKEQLTKEEFVRQINRAMNSAPAVVYKRSGEKKDRIHAEKPQITPLKTSEGIPGRFCYELLRTLPEASYDAQVIDWQTALKETPVHRTKLFSTKNEKNERFSFSIVLPIGQNHDLKHDLAVTYLHLLGTQNKPLTVFNSELYNLALDMSFTCNDFTTTFTVSGLQKYLPRAMALLKERLTLAKNDPDAFRKLVERTEKQRRDNKKNPKLLLSGAVSRAFYGEKTTVLHCIPSAEMKKIDPAELTAHLNALCTTMPREYVYYGPGDPEEVAALIRQHLPEPAEKLSRIPEPVKFKIIPPEENTVYVIRYPSTQVISLLLRPDRVQIPADNAFATMLNNYVSPLFFRELREKRSLGYVAQADYNLPASQPDNYSVFLALLETQRNKLEEGMNTIKSLTTQMPQKEDDFYRAAETAAANIASYRLLPENLYWFRREQLQMKQPLDQMARDLKQVREISMEDFFRRAKEAMNRSKDLWILSGDVKNVPEGFGKIVELKPEDILPR
ncbi:MAG: insulinase family protein [Lentisphaeria bacterium]|nr:insulinase family protein [Lentisphaeria bacterium]